MKRLALGKKIALTFQALTLAFGFGVFSVAAVATLAPTATYAAQNVCDPNNLSLESGAACSQANGTKDNLFGAGGIFQTIANTLIFLVGAVAVLFLIVGGLRYAVSNGDPKNVEAAKNTITYAIVGIVVAILSFAAVQFVITALNKSA
jgi:hypothetical protein